MLAAFLYKYKFTKNFFATTLTFIYIFRLFPIEIENFL